ncbi:MAG: hypothetical protein FWD22_04470, partial [Treponema sp.]|nr:hypothetical protein [Treponema sp.]
MHTNHCKKSILIVPCCEPGKGGGHLTRCISLTCDLRALGTEAFLFMTEQTRDLSSIYNSLNFNPKWCITKPELEIRINNLSERFSLIVLDRFQTPHDELLGWKKIAPVIGIDEGGDFREQFDFLIDILIPEKMGKPRANIANPGLIKFTKDITQRTAGSKGTGTGDTEKVKILISFGQEDPAGLGVKTAHKLSVISKKQKMDITSLRGALSGNTIEVPSGVKIIEA